MIKEFCFPILCKKCGNLLYFNMIVLPVMSIIPPHTDVILHSIVVLDRCIASFLHLIHYVLRTGSIPELFRTGESNAAILHVILVLIECWRWLFFHHLQNVSNLGPATDFYKKLALDCSAQQTAVDLFMMNGQYADLATVCK